MPEDKRVKRYVPVTVHFDTEGKMRPVIIEFDEAHQYPVDKILDVRRAACQSVGGVGDRYTCRIQGQETYLWFEKGRWFVAARMEMVELLTAKNNVERILGVTEKEKNRDRQQGAR